MRSLAIMFILLVASVTSAMAANHLSQAQWSLMKNDTAIAGLDSNAAAAYYNAQYSPVTKAWITSCQAITLDEGANYSAFDSIVAGKRAVPELLQDDVTPKKIAEAVSAMLGDPARYQQVKDDLLQVRTRLGEGGASKRAASVVMEVLGKGVEQEHRA